MIHINEFAYICQYLRHEIGWEPSKPIEFLAMFRYVREKGYETGPFPDSLKKAGLTGTARATFRAPSYLFSGDSGSNRNATRSMICLSLNTLLAPNRGMFEHASTACES